MSKKRGLSGREKESDEGMEFISPSEETAAAASAAVVAVNC